MSSRSFLSVIFSGLIAPVGLHAASILAPGDFTVGGQLTGGNFVVATAGTVADVNNYPTNESPDHIIDGVGQKYLNFAELNTGVIITPGSGASVAGSLKLWTANDSENRDPSSYEIYGTNAVIGGGGPFSASLFTLISSGPLNLPLSRNNGGGAVLDDLNAQTVDFANATAYTSYMVVFPTVKDAPSANSMQIAEIQLFTPVPEPGLVALGGLTLFAGLIRRRR